MQDWVIEALKVSGVFLAIILPTLTAAWAYRNARIDKNSRPPTIGGEGLAAIGGALVTQDMLAKAMDTAHEVRDSINHLARELEKFNEHRSQMADALKDICEEMMKVRRVAEDMRGPSVRRR
jgi:hypothetical protein